MTGSATGKHNARRTSVIEARSSSACLTGRGVMETNSNLRRPENGGQAGLAETEQQEAYLLD